MDFDKEAQALWRQLDNPPLLAASETFLPNLLRKAYRAGLEAAAVLSDVTEAQYDSGVRAGDIASMIRLMAAELEAGR